MIKKEKHWSLSDAFFFYLINSYNNMIYLIKGTSSNVALTLNENLQFGTSSFLFEFINDQSNVSKIFSATDISPATNRYNQFTITDNSTENPYNAQMNFQTGFHRYTVYEMPQAATTSFSPTASIGILETGKVLVKDLTDTDITVITPSSLNDTNIIL